MSNETDLVWLARNVHVWKSGYDLAVVQRGGGEIYVTWPSACSCGITKKQWLARRAELQNKPSWDDFGESAKFMAQDSDGAWMAFESEPAAKHHVWSSMRGWCGYAREGCGRCRGEVLGDWRDTLEKRPADLSEPAVTERLTEAAQAVLAAVPALMDEKYHFAPEFKPVTVSNETVQLERPIAVAGTGNGSAADSAFLIGRVIDLLRTSVDHFSADELADLNELTGAELTKRDAAVCGGQKYLDAHWFERGELPPVGTVCLYVVSDRLSAEVEITAHAKLGLCFVEVGKSGENYVSKTAELHRFRPIRNEREVLADLIESHGQMSALIVADAILAAGFKRGAE